MDDRGSKAVIGGSLTSRSLARLAMRAMSSTVPRTQALIALVLQVRFDEPTQVSLVVGLIVGVTATLTVLVLAALAAPSDDGDTTFFGLGSAMRWRAVIRRLGWCQCATRR